MGIQVFCPRPRRQLIETEFYGMTDAEMDVLDELDRDIGLNWSDWLHRTSLHLAMLITAGSEYRTHYLSRFMPVDPEVPRTPEQREHISALVDQLVSHLRQCQHHGEKAGCNTLAFARQLAVQADPERYQYGRSACAGPRYRRMLIYRDYYGFDNAEMRSIEAVETLTNGDSARAHPADGPLLSVLSRIFYGAGTAGHRVETGLPSRAVPGIATFHLPGSIVETTGASADAGDAREPEREVVPV